MKFRLSIDRFERDKKHVALLADDGTQVNFPKELLPKDFKPGDTLLLTIEKDAEATKQVAEQTKPSSRSGTGSTWRGRAESLA